MQDLSHLLRPDPVSALVPSSEAGGNMQSSNADAMTAPGSRPVDPLVPASNQGDPAISAQRHDRTVVTHADRPVLRMGAWNNL